jgi:hypothetical protein
MLVLDLPNPVDNWLLAGMVEQQHIRGRFAGTAVLVEQPKQGCCSFLSISAALR